MIIYSIQRYISKALVLGIALCGCLYAQAEVKLPNCFSDHMVLQQNKPIVIWGTADASEAISVSLGKEKADTTADAKGHWQVELAAIKGGHDALELKISGTGNNVTLSDILIGEVWLCGGQSNMEWTIAQVGGLDKRDEKLETKALRVLRVPKVSTDQPQSDIPAYISSGKRKKPGTKVVWRVATDVNTVQQFSAVAFYFGRELLRTLDVPIGLLDNNWGGSRIEPWMSPEVLEASAGNAWAKAQGPKVRVNHAPSRLHNGMIVPMDKLNIAGVIWYQGESNALNVEDAKAYRHLMPDLIAQWRKQFRDEKLPFYMVQLAGFNPGGKWAADRDWTILRQAQLETAIADPHAGISNTIDIGHPTNIHPVNKLDVGRRLARLALNKKYNVHDRAENGPIFKEAKASGSKMKVSFEMYGGKLSTSDGKPPRGFEVAGSDGVFHPATVEMKENYVMVWARGVRPVYVRYGWRGLPEANMIGADKLPMLPFISASIFN